MRDVMAKKQGYKNGHWEILVLPRLGPKLSAQVSGLRIVGGDLHLRIGSYLCKVYGKGPGSYVYDIHNNAGILVGHGEEPNVARAIKMAAKRIAKI